MRADFANRLSLAHSQFLGTTDTGSNTGGSSGAEPDSSIRVPLELAVFILLPKAL